MQRYDEGTGKDENDNRRDLRTALEAHRFQIHMYSGSEGSTPQALTKRLGALGSLGALVYRLSTMG